ncbi:MAG: hypothetical protein DRR08_28990 [Candidatus Parabeggiatoa sp. nov. 2]|nr:MAG: hypothetical protein B6247_15075 [Beggiatoa sp. 4572_84]RKZ51711.1 MAG: hypothetical protein DRR08_28990 [Gammaproteobacteria bacterium]
MITKPVVLVGAAVHTRNSEPGQDYDWYVKAGDMQLFESMEEVYRLALRDVGGDVPRLAVIIRGQRVGFLVGDLPSKRQDHSHRLIYDTLYFEFDSQYQRSVLHTAAVLLLCSKKTYKIHEQHFTDYAEQLFYNSHATHLILETVKLPIVDKQPDFSLTPINPEKLVLFSNQVNQNRCARYLIHFAHQEESCFSFVSTGRVSIDKCQQVADKTEKCVLLTLSAEVQTEVQLKKAPKSRLRRIIGF